MKLTAKTLYGLENVLANELAGLGASDIKAVNRAVLFSGSKETLYRVNYCSRTALSVLMPVGEFKIASKEDLYRRALKIKWSDYIDPDGTFSVIPVVNSKIFGHTAFPGLVVKDAIADYFRQRAGRRPSVDTSDPDIVINLHISNDQAVISLDSSVIPLFRRGYRVEQGEAPLNEVLAAGILMLSGWNFTDPLLDPMCGSGTIPIEAGLMACKIPPGKFRDFFGFSRWKDFDNLLFDKVRNEVDSCIEKSSAQIYASDISPKAARLMKINTEKAGLSGFIQVQVSDIKDVICPFTNGYVVLNPPYGRRIKLNEQDDLYRMIGSSLKHNFSGNRSWIITADKECLKNVGLKPYAKHKLYNGALECVLAGYELFEGARKAHLNMNSGPNGISGNHSVSFDQDPG